MLPVFFKIVRQMAQVMSHKQLRDWMKKAFQIETTVFQTLHLQNLMVLCIYHIEKNPGAMVRFILICSRDLYKCAECTLSEAYC